MSKSIRHQLILALVVILPLACLSALLLALGGTSDVAAVSRIYYVKRDAPGPSHNGLSWSTAFTDVQQRLDR